MLALKHQISEAEKIEDNVLKEVTLYSLNRQMAQFANQGCNNAGALARATKKVSIQQRVSRKSEQKKNNDLNQEVSSAFPAETDYIKQIG